MSWVFGLGSLAEDLSFGIFGCGLWVWDLLVWDHWFGIPGLGLWFGILGLGVLVWDL